MQIDGMILMPNMTSTNSAVTGSHLVQKEGRFQDELDAAHERLEKSAKAGVLTKEQIAQRNKDIRDASIQLEALMLKMLYNDMWKTVPKDTFFGDDNAMDIYRDMYHEELTKQMAQNGGIGLADFIYNQLATPQK
ncbi:MAG: rod-binding protein [Selenomonadaceae bacterium]|nr:rod-binding protein [Selenomonadaceae bacterium]